MEGYSPFAVARYFIEKARPEDALTPMKLIKLAYVSHGWHLAFAGAPLLSEYVQAWKYGPVIESLYHGFKCYGNETIPATELTHLHSATDGFSGTSKVLLDKVWEKYHTLSGIELSSLTHQPGTPWYTVWHDGGGRDKTGAVIPNPLIQDFYRRKVEENSGSGH